LNGIFADEKSTGPLLSVAVFEAAKGAVVLLAGLGVVALIRPDIFQQSPPPHPYAL